MTASDQQDDPAHGSQPHRPPRRRPPPPPPRPGRSDRCCSRSCSWVHLRAVGPHPPTDEGRRRGDTTPGGPQRGRMRVPEVPASTSGRWSRLPMTASPPVRSTKSQARGADLGAHGASVEVHRAKGRRGGGDDGPRLGGSPTLHDSVDVGEQHQALGAGAAGRGGRRWRPCRPPPRCPPGARPPGPPARRLPRRTRRWCPHRGGAGSGPAPRSTAAPATPPPAARLPLRAAPRGRTRHPPLRRQLLGSRRGPAPARWAWSAPGTPGSARSTTTWVSSATTGRPSGRWRCRASR